MINIEDIRNVHYCTKGIRLFCSKYNLDYNELRKNGLTEESILATKDSMAIAVVEKKNGRK